MATISATTTPANIAFNGSGFTGTLNLDGSTVGSTYAFTEGDTITASTGNDTIASGSGDDFILSLAGNDSINAGDGNDTIDAGTGVDTVDGGLGTDTATFASYSTGVSLNLALSGAQTLTGGSVVLANVENLIGGSGNDVLVGSTVAGSSANNLNGNAGNDALYGSASNGTAALAYTIPVGLSGAGSYTVTSATFDAAASSLDGADTLVGGAGNDSLYGGFGADNLNGGDGDDLVDGGAGADIMRGGLGNDVYIVDHLADNVTEESIAGGGSDTVLSSVSFSLGRYVEYLVLTGTGNISGTGNVDNDVIVGNAGNNIMNGGAGADQLYGGDGNDNLTGGLSVGTTFLDGVDTLVGGNGNDIYFVNTGDVVVEAAPNMVDPDGAGPLPAVDLSGIDTVSASGSYTLGAGVYVERLVTTSSSVGAALTGNSLAQTIVGASMGDTLEGAGGNDSLDGAGGNDTLYGGTAASGVSSGDDTLNGGAGVDSLVGGDGNDTYYVSDTQDTVTGTWHWDAVSDSGGTQDTVFVSTTMSTALVHANLTGSFTGIERFIVTGSGHVDVTGTNFANTMIGNGGFNVFSAGGGDDSVYGGAGADTLSGGTGNDSLCGGQGNDVYQIDSTGDVIDERAYTVDPTTYNITMGTTDAGGVDTVRLTVATTVAGGGWLGSGGASTYTLAANLENLSLLDTAAAAPAAAFHGQGNALANKITNSSGFGMVLEGLDGADSLEGGSGNDTLAGGDGLDKLTGGLGADHFRFDDKFYTSNGNTFTNPPDRITDFNHGGASMNTAEGDVIEVSWSGYGLGTVVPVSLGGPSPVPLVYKDYKVVTLPDTSQVLTVDYVTQMQAGALGASFVYDKTTGLLSFDNNGSDAGGTTGICYLQAEGTSSVTVNGVGQTHTAFYNLQASDIIVF